MTIRVRVSDIRWLPDLTDTGMIFNRGCHLYPTRIETDTGRVFFSTCG
jgi:hypothetical protein